MDVNELLERAIEPAATANARAVFLDSLARLDDVQREAMKRSGENVRFVPGVLQSLRNNEFDLESLHRHARRLDRSNREHISLDRRLVAMPQLIARASASPAVVSALVWKWLAAEPDLASHIVQNIRERAGLPGMRRVIAFDEPRSMHASDFHINWFGDHQLDDLARWIERVPAAEGESLAESIAATESQRAKGIAERFALVVPFLRQVSSFLLHLSQRQLDPLGFALSRDARLHVDPSIKERIEIANWARQGGRTLCLRGQFVVMSIGVEATWPLAIEVIAAELGRGACPAAGILLRLRSDVAAPTRDVPLFMFLPTEALEDRGARFERWLSTAYVHAVDAWRAWC